MIDCFYFLFLGWIRREGPIIIINVSSKLRKCATVQKMCSSSAHAILVFVAQMFDLTFFFTKFISLSYPHKETQSVKLISIEQLLGNDAVNVYLFGFYAPQQNPHLENAERWGDEKLE